MPFIRPALQVDPLTEDDLAEIRSLTSPRSVRAFADEHRALRITHQNNSDKPLTFCLQEMFPVNNVSTRC